MSLVPGPRRRRAPTSTRPWPGPRWPWSCPGWSTSSGAGTPSRRSTLTISGQHRYAIIRDAIDPPVFTITEKAPTTSIVTICQPNMFRTFSIQSQEYKQDYEVPRPREKDPVQWVMKLCHTSKDVLLDPALDRQLYTCCPQTHRGGGVERPGQVGIHIIKW